MFFPYGEVQRRHGARLVGTWATSDSRVVAVWKYDDVGHCERVEAAVTADPDSASGQRYRAEPGNCPPYAEVFMTSTLDASEVAD